MSPSSQCARIDELWRHNRQPRVHGGPKVLMDRLVLDRGTQSLVVAENLHFLTHLLILARIPSFLHFLTAPDNTSSSERDGIHICACGGLTNLGPYRTVIDLSSLSHACGTTDSGSQTRKNRIPLMLPMVVLVARDAASTVFSFLARRRLLAQSTVAGVCYKSICLSSRTRNSGIKRWYSQGRVVLDVLDLLASCFLVPNIPAT
jgi:hypothetical protein